MCRGLCSIAAYNASQNCFDNSLFPLIFISRHSFNQWSCRLSAGLAGPADNLHHTLSIGGDGDFAEKTRKS